MRLSKGIIGKCEECKNERQLWEIEGEEQTCSECLIDKMHMKGYNIFFTKKKAD